MIKKLVLLIVAALLCIVPMASANDFDVFEDYDRYVTYSFNVENRAINIGEPLTYTITVTNHTDMYFDFFYVSNVFKGSITSWIWDEDELYSDDRFDIAPYETITLEYTRTVPQDIAWYKEEGKYYIDFAPTINYAAENDDDYIDDYNGEICEYFYNKHDGKPIQLEVTNIKDGSQYAQLSIVDDRQFLVYRDTQYEHLYANVNSAATLKNISNKTITIENILYGFDGNACALFNHSILPNESATYEVYKVYHDIESDISEKQQFQHDILFSTDDEFYYAISTVKQYETLIMPPPDIYLQTEEHDDYTTYSVVNNSNKAIDNFVVFYRDEHPITYEQFQTVSTVGTLHANEQWDISKEYTGEYNARIYVGYYIDNCAYYWDIKIHYTNSNHEIVNIPHDGYISKIDHYIAVNNISLTDPDDLIQGECIKWPTYTPYVRGSQIQPTLPPENPPAIAEAPAPTPITKVQVIEEYYIPKWVWPVLSVSVLAVIALSVYTVILQRKKRK